jgi:hypothetical protein
MPSLVLTPRLTSDSLHLEKAAAALGWPVHRAKRYLVPHDIEDPIVYGDLVFCDIMGEMLGLGLLEPNDTWLADLSPKYLLRKVRALSHGDLGKVKGRHFIKPANDKVFEAGIFEQGAYVPHRHIDPAAPVLVSEVVTFESEIRGYVLDRKLLTAGIYAGKNADSICNDGLSAPREKIIYESGCEWMEGFLSDPEIDMPSAVVIDFGFIEGRGWAIVEANQGYCSGVYTGGYATATATPGADPKEVLRVIERSGGLRKKLSPSDRKWQRPGGAW